jgi:uncharacterized protein (TIRG00374 family)
VAGIEPNGLHTGELPRVSYDDTGGPPRPRRYRHFHLTLKLLAFVFVIYFSAVTLIPGFRNAAGTLVEVNPLLLILGLVLELTALYCYTLLTRAALGASAAVVPTFTLFRIQMSTKALSSTVPGGSAAGNALGYRLLTLCGVPGPDAGFALATAGVVSAVTLNIIFWGSLIVSIPIRGVNAGYAFAAVIGIILLLLAGMLVFGLMDGSGRAERSVRWIARKIHIDEDRTAAGLRHIAARLNDLASDRQLLVRVMGWAMLNWLLDAAALWVFIRAYGHSTDIDAILVAFGLVNVLAVIPITPGGLGIIDGGLPLALVGFGVPKAAAALGVATYRLAQFFLPIVLGAVMYASLRVGPWSIKRHERLRRLRDIAADEAYNDERWVDFAARFSRRRRTLDVSGEIAKPADAPSGHDPSADR